MIALTSLPSRHYLGQQLLSPDNPGIHQAVQGGPIPPKSQGEDRPGCLPSKSHCCLYLAIRSSKPGPLFILPDEKWLTCMIFSSAIDNILSEMQMDKDSYNTHSFQLVFWAISQLI